MKRIVWTFGLIGGGIMAVFGIAITFLHQVDFDNGEVIGYATMLLAFLMVFFGIRSYRENVLAGTIRFGRAFKVGLLIALVISTCYVASWEVIYNTTAQDFAEKYAQHGLDKARASGATEEQLAAQRTKMDDFIRAYKNPLINIGYTFVEIFPLGLVVVLVSAGILSRKKGAGGADPSLLRSSGRGASEVA